MNAPVNPFSAIPWLWRALRGRSVTFAALFALGALGIPAVHWLRQALGGLGAPWLAWLILPSLLIAWIARRETEWLPDEAQRAKWVRFLLVSGAIGAVVISLLTPRPPDVPRGAPVVKPMGPRGK